MGVKVIYMAKTLLIATRNKGKVREFERILIGVSFEVVGLDDLGIDIEVEETGSTFEENAVLKAKAYGEAAGVLTLADDSGLVVDALGGEPGVLSARYGGEGLTDDDRVQLVLQKLNRTSGWNRQARFIAVLALVGNEVPNGLVISRGVVEGAIAHEPIGNNGFGYDPIFWITSHTKTTAQMSAEEKDSVSHRGIAMQSLMGSLTSIY